MDASSSQSSSALVLRAVGFLILLVLARFFHRMHQVRTLVRRYHKENDLEMLPHSYLLGHILVTAKIMAKYPRDIYPLSVATLVLQHYPHLEKNGFFVMDSWPFVEPMIYVFDPEMSAQFTQAYSLPKAHMVKSEFRPLTQNKDLVTLDGPEWKRLRSIYNPGFSAKNLMSMAPVFLEEIRVFIDRLRAAAKSGEVLRIEEPITNLATDVIGRAVLGTRMHCQTRHNPFQKALAKQISWVCPEYTPPSLLKLINPARLPLMWNYNRIMRNYLLPILKQTVVSHQAGDGGADMMNPAGPGPGPGDFKTKTVVSLAARAYLAEKKGEGDQPPSSVTVPSSGRDRDDVQLDREFIDMAIAQFVIFIFAGHDTTAVTLCFAYHLLSQNPSCLAKLRAEHDAVFGSQDRDPSPSAAVESSLCANPNLLNSLPYTTAVVKETLRLFPPAATVREGQPDFFLRDPRTGKRYPTAGLLVHQNSYATHHLESLFPRPFEFVPERFLASEGEPLYVRKNAFRPFELGPRACIGQELAVMEIKMILAMTVREFEIESCFPRPGEPGAREILGHTVYQVGHMTGHPKDGMPVRVRVRGTG